MQLAVGDTVFHSIHGVGKVVATKELTFNAEEPRLYYEVAMPHTTVWVLIEPQVEGRLRPITPRSELPRYGALLKSRPISLDNDFRTRQIDLDNRLKLGTFQAICEIVRDLNARRLQIPLTNYESSLLKRTSQFLFEEWAEVSGVTSSEAERGIEELLREGQKNYLDDWRSRQEKES